ATTPRIGGGTRIRNLQRRCHGKRDARVTRNVHWRKIDSNGIRLTIFVSALQCGWWRLPLAAYSTFGLDSHLTHERSPHFGRPTVRPVHEKRDSTKDERRNDAGEFGVKEVRAQRAHHQDAQSQRRGSSRPWNQHTKATENLEHADDIRSLRGIAP